MNIEEAIGNFDGFEEIAKHYGKDIELEKLKEECKELILAVEDYQIDGTEKTLDHLWEECGDVLLCIAHIGFLTHGTMQMTEWVRSKIERQKKRMSREASRATRNAIEGLSEGGRYGD